MRGPWPWGMVRVPLGAAHHQRRWGLSSPEGFCGPGGAVRGLGVFSAQGMP